MHLRQLTHAGLKPMPANVQPQQRSRGFERKLVFVEDDFPIVPPGVLEKLRERQNPRRYPGTPAPEVQIPLHIYDVPPGFGRKDGGKPEKGEDKPRRIEIDIDRDDAPPDRRERGVVIIQL